MIEMEADSSNRELRPNTNIISSEAHQSSDVSADEKGAREGSSGHAEDPNLVEPTTVTKEAEHPARSSEDAANYPTGVKLLAIAVALCFAVFCVALDNTIIATAIPRITDDFHSLEDVGWYSSAYLLCTSAFQLLFGKLYSVFQIKWVYLITLGVFEIGSLICGAAPNSTAFIIGRSVAGLGSAGLFSGSLIILAHSVPLAKRPTYSGLILAMYGIASVAGPLLGGAFTDDPHATWRMCFYINLPFGFITAVVLLFLLKPMKQKKRESVGFMATLMELDPIGTILFVPGIVCLLLALQWGGTVYPWSNGRIIALFVIFGILIIGFVLVQIWKGEHGSTVPPRIARQRSVASGAYYGLTLSAPFFILVYFLPIWFQAIKGTSAVRSGIDNLPLILSQAIGSILAGALVTQIGYYVPFMILGTIFSSVGAGFLTTFHVDTPAKTWIGYQIIFGLGIGFGFQQPVLAAQTVLPIEDVAVGTAFAMFTSLLGASLFTSVAQNRFANSLVQYIVGSGISDLDPQVVIQTGATQLRGIIPPQEYPALLLGYNGALMNSFQVALIMACLTALALPIVQWKSVKGKQVGPGAGI